MKDCTSLLKQFKFNAKENVKTRGFKKDPVGDSYAKIEDGILQKYKGRLLVLASDKCARQCRFCFRRNTPIKKASPEALRKALTLNKDIKEVILSGGDPMMLKKKELQKFFDVIPAHIRIRIHTRIVNFNPLFEKLGSRLTFVSHINHPAELNEKTAKNFSKLAKCGVTLLNQSVLLKGVNDNAEILAELSEKLFSQRVLPYYLHQLDRAQGTAHFEVPIKKAKQIVKELKGMVSGYLVPRFVREIKGEKSKVWV